MRSTDALNAGQQPSLSDALTVSLSLPRAAAVRGATAVGVAPREAPAVAEDLSGSLASHSAGLYNPSAKPPRPFEADYPAGAPPMPQDDSPPTSKEGRSSRRGWSVEEWRADGMKPSRQRNLTTSQRMQLARGLRALRRDYFAAKRDSSEEA
jgi:hypothetical protein